MRLRKNILLGIFVVLGLVIILPVARHYQLKAEVETYFAELKAQGEPTDLSRNDSA